MSPRKTPFRQLTDPFFSNKLFNAQNKLIMLFSALQKLTILPNIMDIIQRKNWAELKKYVKFQLKFIKIKTIF